MCWCAVKKLLTHSLTHCNDTDSSDILSIIFAHSKVIWLQYVGDSAIHTGQAPYIVRHVKAANKCDIVGVGGKDGSDSKKT